MNCQSQKVPQLAQNLDLRLRSPASGALSTTQCCPEKSPLRLNKHGVRRRGPG